MADTAAPSPLVAADVDLTNLPYMPILIARLKQSRAWLVCKRRPELAFYLLNLWTAAWHGRPAASLEKDDDVLADLAMCAPQAWKKVKADVLRGWVECSDGRLYHPVVAEQALSAWEKKVAHRDKMEAARAAKEARRLQKDQGSNPSTEDAKPPNVRSTEASMIEADKGSIIDADKAPLTALKVREGKVREGNKRSTSDLTVGSPAEDEDPFGPRSAEGRGATDPPVACAGADPTVARRDLFARGETVLGPRSGGQISQLLKAKGGNVALARAALETASTAYKARDYVAAIIRGDPSTMPNGQLYDRGL